MKSLKQIQWEFLESHKISSQILAHSQFKKTDSKSFDVIQNMRHIAPGQHVHSAQTPEEKPF